MVRKQRWSFKDDRRLMELARSSTSLEEVVKQTGRSPESLKKMAKRLGISFKSQEEVIACVIGEPESVNSRPDRSANSLARIRKKLALNHKT
jgi:lambda repressor-like predicted transcriptional regulator